MKTRFAVILVVALAGVAMAADLSNRAPIKAPVVCPPNLPAERQGGDTILDAVTIADIPFSDSGTTAGYVNDYDEVCPYTSSTSADVVYRYVSPYWQLVSIDLCGSAFDTKVYVYNGGLGLIACNDDFYTGPPCGQFVSRLDHLGLNAGETYYIVIDGYGGSFGDYQLSISWQTGPYAFCQDDDVLEGEPPLGDGYVDTFNGGCNTPPSHPFQELVGDDEGHLSFCGTSGWYESAGGGQYRDTDWFLLTMGNTGTIAIEAYATWAVYLFELGPQDCASVAVVQSADNWPNSTTMTIGGYAPGQIVWFWVGPTTFTAPSGWGDEFNYVVEFSGLAVPVIAQAATWSTVKALFE